MYFLLLFILSFCTFNYGMNEHSNMQAHFPEKAVVNYMVDRLKKSQKTVPHTTINDTFSRYSTSHRYGKSKLSQSQPSRSTSPEKIAAIITQSQSTPVLSGSEQEKRRKRNYSRSVTFQDLENLFNETQQEKKIWDTEAQQEYVWDEEAQSMIPLEQTGKETTRSQFILNQNPKVTTQLLPINPDPNDYMPSDCKYLDLCSLQ